MHGLNDREACLQANIVPQTLYNYCHENPEFFERKELLKDNTKMIAKNNIHAEIVKGDKSLSQWYLERKDKEFKPKQENDNTEKVIIHLTDYTAP